MRIRFDKLLGTMLLLFVVFPMDCMANDKKSKKIGEAILALPGWRSTTYFNSNEWKMYIDCAKAFQKLKNKDTKRKAVITYKEISEKIQFNGVSENRSKLYLLLRMVYAVPDEKANNSGWIGSEKHKNSFLWPLSIDKKNRFSITDLYRGSMAARFHAVREFDYFDSKFTDRDLSNVRFVVTKNE